VKIGTREVYAVGCVLGLVGSLVLAASQVLAGAAAYGALTLGSTFVFVIVLGNVYRREDFDRDHSRVYRALNFGGALVVVALGLLMLAAGVAFFGAFA
jgi:uncharacterized membrane protein